MFKLSYLGSNKVTHIGIKHLSEAYWSNIAYMTLCFILKMQHITKSAIRDANI